MARAGAELLGDADLVAPVPLHWRRLFTRRYNQAALLARVVARDGNASWRPTCCARVRWTGSQAGLKAGERRRNVRKAFEVHPRWLAKLKGRTVLLVDDVLTTGATVEACTRALHRAGAAHVDVLTLARVVRPWLYNRRKEFPMAKIEIYTTQWCGYCARAQALLDKKGAAFERDGRDGRRGQARRDAHALEPTSVPQIFINGQHIGGSDELAALERPGKLDPLLAQPG